VIALVPLAKYFWIGWLLWAVVLWLTSQHPPIRRRPDLSKLRKVLAVFAIAMLALAFTPTPITGASGRERWPAIRDELMQGAQFVRGEVRHWQHRK
jgi:hypothetical protein